MGRKSKKSAGANGNAAGAGIVRALRTMHEQFLFVPKVGGGYVPRRERYLAVGMGGSALAPELLNAADTSLRIVIHRGYGLPTFPRGEWKRYLVLLISYSGNTEEVLDAFREARANKCAAVCITTGGILLQRARDEGVPFIRLPHTNIQPRMATGYMMRAVLHALGDGAAFQSLGRLARSWRATAFDAPGKKLAGRLYRYTPIIYASLKNFPIAYNWKIKMNETAKIPAFANAFPELNHNEMTGFDVRPGTKPVSARMRFVFLTDTNDHPRIRRRMGATAQLLAARGFPVEWVALRGRMPFPAMISSLALADWTAYHLARRYRVEPEAVPLVEQLKRML